jgi:hypothetical protein
MNLCRKDFPADLAGLARLPGITSPPSRIGRRGGVVPAGRELRRQEEGTPMTFKAELTIPGGGLTARLEPSLNRVEIVTHGTVTAAEIEATLPELLTHLATKAGLPVRHGGRVYRPRPSTAERDNAR